MREQSSAGRQRGAAGERTGGINASLCSAAVPLAPDSHPGRDDVGRLHLLPASFQGRPARSCGLSPSRPSLPLTPTASHRIPTAGARPSPLRQERFSSWMVPPTRSPPRGCPWEAGRGKSERFCFVIKKVSASERYSNRCEGGSRCYRSRYRGRSQQADTWGAAVRMLSQLTLISTAQATESLSLIGTFGE